MGAPASPASSSKRPSIDESEDVLTQESNPHMAASNDNGGSFDIPIFTEEFLNHNRARELELRQLRKQTSEFEEQNAVLGKHIDSMKSAISKLEVETVQQRQNNAALQHQLDQLRQMVVTHFKGLQIPGLEEPVSLQTADQFVSLLHSSLDQQNSPSGLASSVRDIIGKV